MITIIHGQDIVSSRKFYIDERKKSLHPIMFSYDNLDLTNLAQVFTSNSLFDIKNKEIFIENFFSKKKAQDKKFSNIVSFLEKHSKEADMIIWESKEISKKQLSNLKSATVKLFSLPKALFAFLSELGHGNNKKLLYLFHKTLEHTEVELVFYMIARQFRLLLAVLGKSQSNQIDEIKNMQPWQKTSLVKQANFFTEKHLKIIYKKLCNMDISQKTGQSVLSLCQDIDFFLLSI